MSKNGKKASQELITLFKAYDQADARVREARAALESAMSQRSGIVENIARVGGSGPYERDDGVKLRVMSKTPTEDGPLLADGSRKRVPKKGAKPSWFFRTESDPAEITRV